MRKIYFLGLLFLLIPTSGVEGVEWVEIRVDTAPPGRFHHSMTYDSIRKKVVLFGGNVDGWIGNDTWEFDVVSKTWEKIDTSVAPPGLNYHAMSFDSTHGVVILFGGVIDRGTQQNDTWVYDGTTWRNMHPSSAPSIRRGHSMVYDPVNDKTILFGGIAKKDKILQPVNDTWVYDYPSNTWTQLNLSSAPSPRHTAATAYDSDRGVVVLYGGNTGYHSGHNVDTWTFSYTDSKWLEMSPPEHPSPPRGDFDMAYVPEIKRSVLFGGYNKTHNFGDTWTYNSATDEWEELPVAGPVARGSDGSLEYTDEGILLFGGFTDHGENETWILKFPQPSSTASTQSSSDSTTVVSSNSTTEQSTSSSTPFFFSPLILVMKRRKMSR